MASPRPVEPAAPLLRNYLVPIWLVLAAALYWWAHLAIWQVLLAVLPLVLLYVWAPIWAKASIESFDRDSLALRASGRYAALKARYHRAIGMRLFAPPALVAERRGQVLQEAGDASGALEAFRRALSTAGEPPPLAVIVGMGHAAYDAKNDDEAIGAYRRVVGTDPSMPRVRQRLAHALLRRGKKTDLIDAVGVIDLIPDSPSTEAEVSLLRALAAARRGKARTARGIERGAKDAKGAFADAVRADIDAAIAERKAAKAAKSGGAKAKKAPAKAAKKKKAAKR
jgi:tetratricopeptide (TPR) repeat protein